LWRAKNQSDSSDIHHVFACRLRDQAQPRGRTQPMLLLNTDVMIDLLRRHPPALAWLTSLGSTQLVSPSYVVMELIQGCCSKAEQNQLGWYGRVRLFADDEKRSIYTRHFAAASTYSHQR
jgi:predicted nucleic acid-binding protein